MDLQSRKIEFVQEFLELHSEEAVARLETFLRKEKEVIVEKDFKPMTKEELNKRVEQSEKDFKNNRSKRTEDLLFKYR